MEKGKLTKIAVDQLGAGEYMVQINRIKHQISRSDAEELYFLLGAAMHDDDIEFRDRASVK